MWSGEKNDGDICRCLLTFILKISLSMNQSSFWGYPAVFQVVYDMALMSWGIVESLLDIMFNIEKNLALKLFQFSDCIIILDTAVDSLTHKFFC